jgi:hypothetical protein
MPITFPVSDVSLGEPNKWAQLELKEVINRSVKVQPEACGANTGSSFLAFPEDRWNGTQKMNGFLNAIHVAFDLHYPLVLSPDDVWLAIAQGFAAHVNQHAEELRKQFVEHDGKAKIVIERNGFRKGSPDNDWMGGFHEFSDKIAEHIGKKRDLLVGGFSTTGPQERAASEIVLMDAMKSYFDYGCRTCCGIPNVTLLGTVDDWTQIRDRAQVLAEFKCEAWVKSLTAVLDRFVAAAKGSADPKFWQSLYHEGGGSGGPYVTGFVNVFFPYVGQGKYTRSNRATFEWSKGIGHMCGGPTPGDFPMGLSSVPFEWEYFDQTFPMQFLGGFVGATQDPDTLAVRPSIGWAVADSQAV